MTKLIDEEAVSEVIGVILLISVTVLGVAIVAVTVLSQPAPSEIPRVSVVAGGNNTTFVLYHEGGDALTKGNYRIYTDNGSGLVDRTDEFVLAGDDGVWSIGKPLTYTGSGTPGRVVISVVDSGGGETMIDEPAYVAGVMDAGGYVDEGGSGQGSGTEPEPAPEPEPDPTKFIDFVINESVFVYGNTLSFSGNNVNGPGATVVITGGLDTADTNLGASIAVSHIYIDGDVTLMDGSAGLGSPTEPGYICINGNLTLLGGGRNLYGDVYINGNFDLGGVTIYDNVYVNGDLTLRREEINLVGDAHVYYTGTVNVLEGVGSSKLEKCTHQTTVPGFTIPDREMPSTKSKDWYAVRNYTPDGALTTGAKIFADNYSYTPTGDLWAENVIVIAKDGDICIERLGGDVTGVFFAPNGKMTFKGDSLEGVVIARDGFFVTSGGTQVTFKNVEEYISDPADYPF